MAIPGVMSYNVCIVHCIMKIYTWMAQAWEVLCLNTARLPPLCRQTNRVTTPVHLHVEILVYVAAKRGFPLLLVS